MALEALLNATQWMLWAPPQNKTKSSTSDGDIWVTLFYGSIGKKFFLETYPERERECLLRTMTATHYLGKRIIAKQFLYQGITNADVAYEEWFRDENINETMQEFVLKEVWLFDTFGETLKVPTYFGDAKALI